MAPPEERATSTIVNTTTTFMVVQVIDTGKGIVLTSNPPSPGGSTEGRIVYIKGTSGGAPTLLDFSIHCSTGVTIYPGFENRSVQPYYCVTLLENPVNTYNLLNYYNASVTDYAAPEPPTVAVPLAGNKSFVFVDLQTQSKAILLPEINTVTSNTTEAPYFMIKDSYGYAGVNNLFISTTASASIEGLGNSIRLQASYCAIELVGDKTLNRWHIVNFYGGAL
jgi:hypothetical protein